MRPIVVGTRKSQLAVTQTDWVIKQLKKVDPTLEVSKEKIVTKGDQILHVTLSKVGGKGLFVKEIEQALLDKRIDLAIHSMKDMPAELPEGLIIGAIPVREDPQDCLISREGLTLEELPEGAVVGTSSLRRQSQILAARPDLVVKPIRGNLNTRLKKLEDGDFAAIILAAAGLKRLGWSQKVTEVLPMTTMLPAVGQGALAVQCRADDKEIRQLLSQINDEATAKTVHAERAFLHSFQGGCHMPLAAYAKWEGGQIQLSGLVADPNGSQVIQATLTGTDPWELGANLAARLIEQGADQLLARIKKELVV